MAYFLLGRTASAPVHVLWALGLICKRAGDETTSLLLVIAPPENATRACAPTINVIFACSPSRIADVCVAECGVNIAFCGAGLLGRVTKLACGAAGAQWHATGLRAAWSVLCGRGCMAPPPATPLPLFILSYKIAWQWYPLFILWLNMCKTKYAANPFMPRKYI